MLDVKEEFVSFLTPLLQGPKGTDRLRERLGSRDWKPYNMFRDKIARGLIDLLEPKGLVRQVNDYTTDSDSLNVDLSLASGTYNTVVQAWDNCGGVGKTPVTITVSGNTLPPPKFVYSSDNAGNVVYEYLVDASTGSLTATTQGSISTPAGPARIASDQGGFRLYVSSSAKSGSALAAYFINRDNGTLQAVPGSAGALSGYPTAVAVHPSGDFVYVTTTAGSDNQTNYIYAFKVNSNGSLTAVSGSPFVSKYWPTQAVIDPTGSYLYASTFYTAAYVEAYDINKSTGALTPMAGQPFPMPVDKNGCASGAYDMAFAQSGQHLVVPEWACNGAITVFDVNSNGTLADAPGSPVMDPIPAGEAVSKTEDSLAYKLACLKAVRVGRGRDGRWDSYVTDKLQPLTVRTIDRWIKKVLEQGALPEWAAAKLTANKKKVNGPPPPRYKMNLGLSFAGLADKSLVARAIERFGKEGLTDLILERIREEMGQ